MCMVFPEKYTAPYSAHSTGTATCMAKAVVSCKFERVDIFEALHLVPYHFHAHVYAQSVLCGKSMMCVNRTQVPLIQVCLLQ